MKTLLRLSEKKGLITDQYGLNQTYLDTPRELCSVHICSVQWTVAAWEQGDCTVVALKVAWCKSPPGSNRQVFTVETTVSDTVIHGLHSVGLVYSSKHGKTFLLFWRGQKTQLSQLAWLLRFLDKASWKGMVFWHSSWIRTVLLKLFVTKGFDKDHILSGVLA